MLFLLTCLFAQYLKLGYLCIICIMIFIEYFFFIYFTLFLIKNKKYCLLKITDNSYKSNIFFSLLKYFKFIAYKKLYFLLLLLVNEKKNNKYFFFTLFFYFFIFLLNLPLRLIIFNIKLYIFFTDNIHSTIEYMCTIEYNNLKLLKIEILKSKIYLNGLESIFNSFGIIGATNKLKFINTLLIGNFQFNLEGKDIIIPQKLYLMKIADNNNPNNVHTHAGLWIPEKKTSVHVTKNVPIKLQANQRQWELPYDLDIPNSKNPGLVVTSDVNVKILKIFPIYTNNISMIYSLNVDSHIFFPNTNYFKINKIQIYAEEQAYWILKENNLEVNKFNTNLIKRLIISNRITCDLNKCIEHNFFE